MKNKLTQEEQNLHNKLDSIEFDYQDAHWAEMQDMLGKKGFFSKYGSVFKAAAVLVTVSSAVYLLNSSEPEQVIAKSEKVATNEITVEQAKDELKENGNSAISPKEELTQKASVEADKVILTIPEEKNQTQEIQESSAEPLDVIVQEKITEEKPAANEEKGHEEVSIFQPSEGELKISGKKCIGETILVHSNLMDSQKNQFDWYINGVKASEHDRTLSLKINESGKYEVKLMVTNKGAITHNSETSFQVNSLIDLDFTYEDQKDVFHDFEAKLKAQPSSLGNYVWLINGHSVASQKGELTHQFDQKGIHDVKLTHTSGEGCISELSKPVLINQDFQPLVNAFSPNGDGFNDEFILKSFTIVDADYQIDIYDIKNGGDLIYHANSINQPWNGRRNNTGELMPAGVYLWKVQIQNKDGVVKHFTDKVTLKK